MHTAFRHMSYNGIYPDNCKIARIVPVYKNGDQTETNNYRPNFNLDVFF